MERSEQTCSLDHNGCGVGNYLRSALFGRLYGIRVVKKPTSFFSSILALRFICPVIMGYCMRLLRLNACCYILLAWIGWENYIGKLKEHCGFS